MKKLANTLERLTDTLNVSTDNLALIDFANDKATVSTFDGTDNILLEGVDRWVEIEIDFSYTEFDTSFDPDCSNTKEGRYVGLILEVKGNDEHENEVVYQLCDHTKEQLIDILNKNVEL